MRVEGGTMSSRTCTFSKPAMNAISFIEIDWKEAALRVKRNLSAAQGQELPLRQGLPVPLYEHIKRQMAEAILVGSWPPGTVLPGEVALAARFGVAVGTVRRALSDMTAEGMLARRRKTGTIVTGRSPHHNLRNFFQYFRLHDTAGALLRSTARVLSLTRTPANETEAGVFGVERGAELIRIRRLRLVTQRPVMHETMAIPAARLPEFPRQAKDLPQLLYLHLLERYGIRLSAVRESVTAALASDEDRRLLQLASPAAILVIDEKAYDQSGAAMLICQHRATTDGYCYLNEIS
jgi:GntR family transcriptional regulator